MLILKERTRLASNAQEIDAFTRKQLSNAASGQVSLIELEKMSLSRSEVSKFLMRQIPIMRAAAIAGQLNALGLLFEEIHRALAPVTLEHQVSENKNLTSSLSSRC
jgi:hypothetical protein